MPSATKAIAILIEPDGSEWFCAFGPMTKERADAAKFVNASIATKFASAQIYGDPQAFWNSERAHSDAVRKARRGWSYRIEEVAA